MTEQTVTSDPTTNTQTQPTSSTVDREPQENSNQLSGGSTIFKSALAALALITAVLVVGNGIVYLMDKADFGKSIPIAQTHLETLAYSTIIGISAVFAATFIAKKLGSTVASVLFGIYNPASILKYALSGAAVAGALLLINAITAAMTGTATPTAVAPFQVMNGSTLAFTLAHTIVLAPIAEEMLFRGVLLAGVRRSSIPGATIVMVLLSSFGFALFHIIGSIFSAGVYAFNLGDLNILTTAINGLMPSLMNYLVAGIALAALSLKTKNIYASWAAHALFNMALLYGVDNMLERLIIH